MCICRRDCLLCRENSLCFMFYLLAGWFFWFISLFLVGATHWTDHGENWPRRAYRKVIPDVTSDLYFLFIIVLSSVSVLLIEHESVAGLCIQVQSRMSSLCLFPVIIISPATVTSVFHIYKTVGLSRNISTVHLHSAVTVGTFLNVPTSVFVRSVTILTCQPEGRSVERIPPPLTLTFELPKFNHLVHVAKGMTDEVCWQSDFN